MHEIRTVSCDYMISSKLFSNKAFRVEETMDLSIVDTDETLNVITNSLLLGEVAIMNRPRNSRPILNQITEYDRFVRWMPEKNLMIILNTEMRRQAAQLAANKEYYLERAELLKRYVSDNHFDYRLNIQQHGTVK